VTADDPVDYRIHLVEQALAQDPAVAELGLQVLATGNTMVISGTVATAERQRAACELVRRLLPDVDVRDNIKVTNLTEPAGEEDVP
jgi:hypothetical protein